MRIVAVMFVGGNKLNFEADSFHYETGRIIIYKGYVNEKTRETVGVFMADQVVGVYFADAIAEGDGVQGQEVPAPAIEGDAPTFGEQRAAEEWRKSHRPGEDSV